MRTTSIPYIVALSLAALAVHNFPALSAVVEYRLETVDSEGAPIEHVPIGSALRLQVWVSDIRPNPTGVLSAYLDVEYDDSLVSVVAGSLEHGPEFGDIARGDLSTPPILDELGSFRRGSPDEPMLPEPTPDPESLLFELQFSADRAGNALFTSNAADTLPRNATTVFGLDDGVVPEDTVFGQVELLILSDCDLDADTRCNVNDINLLNSVGDLVVGVPVALTDPIFDLDNNDVVNHEDVDIWLTAAAINHGFDSPYLRGDATLDGSVDAADLNALALNWRQESDLWSTGDFTGNGSVDASDLNQLALSWRESIAIVGASAAELAAVPEPTSLFLTSVIGLLMAANRIRRRV